MALADLEGLFDCLIGTVSGDRDLFLAWVSETLESFRIRGRAMARNRFNSGLYECLHEDVIPWKSFSAASNPNTIRSYPKTLDVWTCNESTRKIPEISSREQKSFVS